MDEKDAKLYLMMSTWFGTFSAVCFVKSVIHHFEK